MEQLEFSRRVAVYLEVGTFEGLSARESAAELARQFEPVFAATFQKSRAVDLPEHLLGRISRQRVSPGRVRRELSSVFARRTKVTETELCKELAEVLWSLYSDQEASIDAEWNRTRHHFG